MRNSELFMLRIIVLKNKPYLHGTGNPSPTVSKEFSNQNNYALRITNYALNKYLYPLHIHILRTGH